MRTGSLSGRSGRLGLRAFSRLTWDHSDGTGRFFLVLLFVGYLFPLALAVWLIRTYGYSTEVAFGFALILGSFLFREAFLAPLFTIGVIRELIRRGRLKPDDDAYFELIRYLEAYGVNARLRGDVGWALAYWAIWYATMVGAVIFSLGLAPVLGPWTPIVYLAIDFPIAFGAFAGHRIRQSNLYRDAREKGFRLLDSPPDKERALG